MQKQKMKLRRLICGLICIIICLFSATTSVFALESINPDAKAGITIKYSVEDTEFALYRVAGVSSENVFTPTEDFKDYPLEWNGLDAEGYRALAETLGIYIKRDNIKRTATAVVNESGLATADNLKTGLYYVIGIHPEYAVSEVKPLPFLVCLPSGPEDDRWVYHPTVVAKRMVDDSHLIDSTERRVIKAWEDASNKENRPDSVEIELLRDGKVVDTVELNKKNNWSHTWENLSKDYEWSVMEKNVPEDYTVSVVREKTTFFVTNKYVSDGRPLPYDQHLLPYTGQLWWPVPVLAMAGMICMIIGLLRRKIGEEDV